MTIARQVEQWYESRKEHLSKQFSKVQFGSTEPDQSGGDVGIAIEGPTTVVSITIFNTGLITIPAIDKATKRHFVLEHRQIAPDEDLAVLLDRYVEDISQPGQLRKSAK